VCCVFTGADCLECPPGTFSTVSGAVGDVCTVCPAGTWSDSPARGTACIACLHASDGRARSEPGSTSKTACVCLKGHGSDACERCAPGWFKDTEGPGSCTLCLPGSYSEGNAAHGCTACPVDTDSLGGSVSADDCVCKPGFAGSEGGAPGCIPCPEHSSAPSGGKGVASCKCNAGFSLEPEIGAKYIRLSDNNFEAGADQRLADLGISQELRVTVMWETRAFEVRNKSGVAVVSPDVFEGITELFLTQDVGELFYGCRGCIASGRINLLSATYGCVAAPRRGESSHRVFSSPGSLDKMRSCKVRCAEGFFRIHNLGGARCQPHWEPACSVGEFLVAGTHENNAYCRACSGCAGRQLSRTCTLKADAECVDCEGTDVGDSGRVWTNAHGEPCREGCVFGSVLNRTTRVCETCTHRCPAGYGFPPAAERSGCTHCVGCETLTSAPRKPAGGIWDAAEDRQDCVATCPTGYALASPSGALECVKTPPADSPEQAPETSSSARCAEGKSGKTCLLPGCTLHEGVCTACFELPESVRRGRLSVEAQELLPGQGILSVEDRERFRWQFVASASCEWRCLQPWVPIQSAEGTYWKCETREVVEAILADHSWATGAADAEISLEWAKSQVADSDGDAEKYERVLRWLVVLACAGAPVAMMLCVVCLNITRACFHPKQG
jgi:hypothetical protein